MKRKLDPLAEASRLKVMSAYENSYFDRGFKYVAGVDECGRGCLAGPVAAAAVIFPPGVIIEGIDDSKKLSPARREALYSEICEKALAASYAAVDADIIDEINILQASLRAMAKAVSGLPLRPEAILIDGRFVPEVDINGLVKEPIVGGDGKSLSIAAASIVAKVTRDRLMRLYDEDYPEYGFARHKGYGTSLHYAALERFGPCPIHRKSFNLRHFSG